MGRKSRAGRPACMAINTASITLIPSTIIAVRATAGSANPEEIIGIKIHETWMNGKVTYKAKL